MHYLLYFRSLNYNAGHFWLPLLPLMLGHSDSRYHRCLHGRDNMAFRTEVNPLSHQHADPQCQDESHLHCVHWVSMRGLLVEEFGSKLLIVVRTILRWLCWDLFMRDCSSPSDSAVGNGHTSITQELVCGERRFYVSQLSGIIAEMT